MKIKLIYRVPACGDLEDKLSPDSCVEESVQMGEKVYLKKKSELMEMYLGKGAIIVPAHYTEDGNHHIWIADTTPKHITHLCINSLPQLCQHYQKQICISGFYIYRSGDTGRINSLLKLTM